MVEVTPLSSGELLRPFIQVLILAPLYFLLGTVLGQSAGMLPQLMEANSNARIDRDEATWIASISTIGMCITAFLSGPISDKFGRVRTCQIAYLFMGVGYAVMLAANSFLLLALGRFLAGLGQGCVSPASVHVSEVSPPAYRSLLLSMNHLMISTGLIYMFTLGGYLPWKIAAATTCLLSVFGLVPTFFTYESPAWLVRKNKMDVARKSISLISGSINVEAKLKELQGAADNTPDTKFTIGVFALPTVWKPFLMLFLLSVLHNGSGFHIIMFYAVNFMREFRSKYDALQITVAIGVVRLLGTIVSSYLQRRVGRRIIGAMSGFSSAALFLVIYAYLYFERSVPYLEQNSWIPIVFFTAAVMTMTAGIFPLPLIMPFEMFPIGVRGLMSGLSLCGLFIVMFGTLKLYNVLLDNLRMEGMILMFAVSSGLFGLFSVTVLVETHMRTLDEIEAVFAGTKGRRGNEMR